MANDKEEQIEQIVQAHLPNAEAIIRELARLQICGDQNGKPSAYLNLPDDKIEYRKHINEKFADVITTPSIAYINKTKDGWLIVGDNRKTIANQILLINEKFGEGVGMLVLHAQQMNAGHIPLVVKIGDESYDMTHPTQKVCGARSEQIISVPIREYRADNERLNLPRVTL